ncbi:hypothetical protein SVIOM342S_00477 [Streptomyces violaceorubidus]
MTSVSESTASAVSRAAGVDQSEGDHLAAQGALQFGVGAGIGAETGAGQDPVPEDHVVALGLVDVLGGVHSRVAAGGEPVVVRRRLRGAFGVPEPGHQHAVVDHGGAVGGEHHVGQALDGVDHVDGVAVLQVEPAQRVPLLDRQVGVDRLAGSIGIDRIGDVEVRRTAHQVVAGSGLAAGR